MKKLIAICLTLALFTSCSNDDDDITGYSTAFMPVTSVDIPEEFEIGKTYTIFVSYIKPTTCYGFRDFYYAKDENTRTVAPVNFIVEASDCETLDNEIVEEPLDVFISQKGSYIFKFWQGDDDEGEPQYLTIEVPVVDGP